MVLKRKDDGSMFGIFIGVLGDGFDNFLESNGAGHRKAMLHYWLLIAILHDTVVTCTSISKHRYPF